MNSLERYSVSSTTFASTFKLIRHQVIPYFGELRLMQNLKTKQKVFVQDVIFNSSQELDIFMEDIKILIQLNQCQNFSKFICYSIQFSQKNSSGKMYIVYQTNSKLSQVLKSISFYQQKTKHNQSNSKHLSSVHQIFSDFGQNSLINLISCVFTALKKLQNFGLVHRCLIQETIIVQNFGEINQRFQLIFTRQTIDAVDLIVQKKLNIEMFNLSFSQISRLNNLQKKQKSKNNSDSSSCPDKAHTYRINSDYQSLGLILIKILNKSLGQQFHPIRLYKMSVNYQIQLNIQAIQQIFQQLRIKSKYSKQVLNFVQFLIFSSQNSSVQELQNLIYSVTKSQFHNEKYQINVSSLKKSRKSNTSYQTPIQRKMLISKAEQNSTISPNIVSVFSPNLYGANEQNFLQTIKRAILYDSKGNYHPNITQKKFKDGSKYIGQYNPQKNCKQGQGIYFYFQGDIYGGKWKNDQLNGYGMYLFANGDKYQGEVLQGKKQGYGVYSYSNGNIYKGFWKEDQKSGSGEYVFANKDIYQGQFQKGARHGQGIFKCYQGDIYEGQFYKGSKDGKGILKKKNGDQIRGFWIKNELAGEVQINFHQTKSRFRGQYMQEELNGIGSFKCLNEFCYEGQLKQNSYQGHAQIHFSNGDHYVGEMHKNKMHGNGAYYYNSQGYQLASQWYQNIPNGKSTLTFTNGTKIHLTYNMGKASRFGKIQYKNGEKYQGQIGQNGRHGKGRYYFSDNKVIQGVFEQNKLVQSFMN